MKGCLGVSPPPVQTWRTLKICWGISFVFGRGRGFHVRRKRSSKMSPEDVKERSADSRRQPLLKGPLRTDSLETLNLNRGGAITRSV